MQGVRVLDCANVVAGPIAARDLGDMGADVIKVEPPGGDMLRGGSKDGLAAMFLSVNRNKRSVALDLQTSAGQAKFRRLLQGADVLIHNMRPDAARRNGVDEATVRAARPDIIFAHISGFGGSGPRAGQRSYDPVIQALSGLASIQADASGRPHLVRTLVADQVTGASLAQAILAALFERKGTGKGASIELSMLDALVAFLWPEGFAPLTRGKQWDRYYYRDLIYRAKDGRYLVAAANSDKEWKGLCRALKKEEWLTDDRFLTGALRSKNVAARYDMTDAAVGEWDSSEILARLEAEDVPCALVNHPQSMVLEDPQVQHNKLIVEQEHPVAGQIRQARPAVQFPGVALNPAPSLDQHQGATWSEPSKPVLWGAAASRAGRCLWALEELGIDYEHKDVVSRSPETLSPEFLSLNPAGKIPVLVDGDLVMNESAAIIAYLADKYGGLAPVPGSKLRARYDSWCYFVVTELDSQGLYMHRKHVGLTEVYGEAPEAVEAARLYFLKQLAVCTKALSSSAWLLPDFSGADILLGHCLFWAARIGWLPQDAVVLEYMRRIAARPSWQKLFAAMPVFQPVLASLGLSKL